MDHNNPGERNDVRVAVFFPIRWKKPDNVADLSAEIENHRTCDRFATPPTAFTDLPSDLSDITEFQEMEPHTLTMWMSLERKLDHIIRRIDQKTFDNPNMEQGRCLNISAGGAYLRISKKLAVGDTIQARLAPPTFPLFIVEILGVVMSIKPDKNNKGDFLVSVSFTAINHSDREDLITYVFKRQREILREKSD
ncbi:hypothetical protein MNBD_NITROSPINAE04-1512 [hydrothermal vent metagenome]|uniref:PilZ domain-containing protein n=1 Tax=hydrothermal vent metagenome TaxID=652676 RepID=A0A3B1BDI0_9ZZZZ